MHTVPCSPDFKFKDEVNSKIGIYISKLYIADQLVSECKICINPEKTSWSIASWHTNEKYKHQGYGTTVLKHTLDKMCAELPRPEELRYIWNGANQYVMDWLTEHFEPVCLLPIAAQKHDDIDDWDAHIYILNKNKLFEYLCIK